MGDERGRAEVIGAIDDDANNDDSEKEEAEAPEVSDGDAEFERAVVEMSDDGIDQDL